MLRPPKMQSAMLDPDRVNTALWIMSKYSQHIEKDDTIVFRQDGDPCNTYRGERPRGRVTSVMRGEDGFVELRGVLESGEEFVADNQSIHPSKVWDVSSDTGEDIYRRVHGSGDEEEEDAEDDVSSKSNSVEDMEDTYGDSGSVEGDVKFDELSQRVSDVELSLAKAVKELSEDIIRGSMGKPLEFAYRFAEKFAEMESSSSMRDGEYQGTKKEEHQWEKDNFSDDEKEVEKGEFRGHAKSKKSVTPVSYSNTSGQYAVYADTEITQ